MTTPTTIENADAIVVSLVNLACAGKAEYAKEQLKLLVRAIWNRKKR